MTGKAPSKNGKPGEQEEGIETGRVSSPPLYTTPAARGVHVPSFSSFQPRDVRFPSPHPVSHVAWNCDGQKLASVGIDRAVRVWQPEKSFDTRNSVQYMTGGHDYDVDYVAWNPTHPDLFCSSSQRDKKIVFWDARQTRSVQTYTHHQAPSHISYSPDGKTICFITTTNQLFFMTYNQGEGDAKPQWSPVKRDTTITASNALFNHTGEGLALSHIRQNTLMIMDYPALTILEQPAAHVGGCLSVALDPRGRYLASGGNDSIVNLYDVNEWICVNTITASEHAINSLSFSHDGEYLAIASQGSYINICSVETTQQVHKVPTIASAPTVTWHPSKYVFAYCGQQVREGSTPIAFLSLFGPGM